MKRLTELRKAKRITQVKLAMDMNISQKMISAYERGKNEPSIKMLKELANYFNTTVDYLIGFTYVKNPTSKISTISVEEAELLEIYRKLSAKNKNKAIGVILGLI